MGAFRGYSVDLLSQLIMQVVVIGAIIGVAMVVISWGCLQSYL